MDDYLGDLRRAPRARHDSVFELYDEAGRPWPETARLVDLSAVGVAFTSTRALARGERVRGRLRLLGIGVVEVAGHVVRRRELENRTFYAVEFDGMSGQRRVSASEEAVPEPFEAPAVQSAFALGLRSWDEQFVAFDETA